MKKINVRIWRNEVANDWSVEINGKLRRHVSAETLDDLVEFAVVAAQEALLKCKKSAVSKSEQAPAIH